jgi:hypothetical protein
MLVLLSWSTSRPARIEHTSDAVAGQKYSKIAENDDIKRIYPRRINIKKLCEKGLREVFAGAAPVMRYS